MSAHDQGSLFGAILSAADRDHCSGARPLISYREDDEPEFVAEVERRSRARIHLARRGSDHGRAAELDPRGLVAPLRGRRVLEAMWSSRWMAARPVFVAGLCADELVPLRADLDRAVERGAALGEPGGLRTWLASRAADLGDRFRIGDDLPLFDGERDVQRVAVHAQDADDLWLKAGRLSTHPADRSLRVRFSFGSEEDDDASHDEARHGLVTELAQTLLPEAAAVGRNERLLRLLERFCGRSVRPTQHIAYWNAPHGGALFHHDGFREEFASRQLGVAFVQLVGRTLWLALSVEDLAERAAEFLQLMVEGELAWVREDLFPDESAWSAARALAADRPRLAAELVAPGCGRLAGLVNRGPEFTALLLDGGHGLLLRPGDVLLLPNHGIEPGRERTAMHSVFCADSRPTYALSMALRAAPEPAAT